MNQPAIIAHRGFAGVAPENTLGAFRAVADRSHPADMIEFDVMPCADGTVVVIHDTRLEGRGDRRGQALTDASGVVWETDCAVVRSAHVLGSEETVPTLADVVDAIPPTVGLNVELRNPGSAEVRFGEALDREALETQRDLWEPFVERVVETLDRADHDILFSSFFEAAIATAREFAPEFPAAVNVYRSLTDSLSVAGRYDCEAIHPRLNMLRGTPFFGQPRGSLRDPSFGEVDLLRAARDLGCEVNVWTIKTPEEAAAIADLGVDGLIADYPDLLRDWKVNTRA